VDLHQQAVAGFIERVQREPAPRIRQRQVVLAPGCQTGGQFRQHAGQLQAQTLGGERLPIIELRRSPQGEPGQEIAPEDLRRLGQGGKAIIAQGAGRVTVSGHPLHQAAKPPDIHAQSRGRPQRHAGAVNRQPLFAGGPTEVVEAPAQRRMSLGLVQLRPEQCGERVAAVRLIGGGQMCEQGERLVAMERHRGACPLSAG